MHSNGQMSRFLDVLGDIVTTLREFRGCTIARLARFDKSNEDSSGWCGLGGGIRRPVGYRAGMRYDWATEEGDVDRALTVEDWMDMLENVDKDMNPGEHDRIQRRWRAWCAHQGAIEASQHAIVLNVAGPNEPTNVFA